MSTKSMKTQSPSLSPRSQTSPSQQPTSKQPLVSSKGMGQPEIYSYTKWITTATTTAAGELMSKSKTTSTNTQGILFYEGEKYYQTAISVWICQSGILSLYPGGEGWTLDGKKSRQFREDLQSKFNTYSFTPCMQIQSNQKILDLFLS